MIDIKYIIHFFIGNKVGEIKKSRGRTVAQKKAHATKVCLIIYDIATHVGENTFPNVFRLFI